MDNRSFVLVARIMSVLTVPLIGWVLWTVDGSAKEIAVMQDSVMAVVNQIDLKLQLRDEKIDSINSQLESIQRQLNEGHK